MTETRPSTQAEGGGTSQVVEGILFASSIVSILLTVVALFLVFRMVRAYKKSSAATALVYFLQGTVILGAIRIFFLFVDINLLVVQDVTVTVIWHLLFYLAIFLFLRAGIALVRLINITQSQETYSRAVIVSSLTGILALMVLLSSHTVDMPLAIHFADSFWDRIGVHHFLAFAGAGLAAEYLFILKQRFRGVISVIASPFLLALGFLSLVHLWELLTESWKVIHVAHGVIELGEQIIWLPAFLLIIYAYWRFQKLTENTQQPTGTQMNPVA